MKVTLQTTNKERFHKTKIYKVTSDEYLSKVKPKTKKKIK